MSNPERNDPSKQRPMTAKPARDKKAEQRAEEVLRDQAKTEVEERPYLDTEGGE